MNKLFNENLRPLREEISSVYDVLLGLTEGIQHDGLKQTVAELKTQVYEPFMFVIVGEVKAGKSSFINALLGTGKEICKVAPSPMTDTIQQIIYGPEEKIVDVNQYIKKIYQPVDILKEVAIVDTPGTNTIIAHHQEITENFIPSSDLIVFVFESKNPYRQSAWEFFDYIHADWRKKIIFILQQKDLMEPADLVINLEGVRNNAIKKGIDNPNVFAVSAKQEIEGLKDESGFIAVNKYITENITSGKAPFLKIESNLSSASKITQKIDDGLKLRRAQLDYDISFRNDIKKTLTNQEEKSNNQVEILIENLLAAYDKATRNKVEELKSGLSFLPLVRRSFSSIFTKSKSIKDWLEELVSKLENDLNIYMKDRLQSGVVDIADSIQQMGKMIDLKIKTSETILKNNHEIFSDIAERRANVLKELQQAFSKFLSRSENYYDESVLKGGENLAPNMAVGGGIAVVGVILTMVTQMAVVDITGGILTGVGLLFAGVSIGMRKRKIVSEFEAEINQGRIKLEEEVRFKLNAYIGQIKNRIDQNFFEFDKLIEFEEKSLAEIETQQAEINSRIGNVRNKLNSIFEGFNAAS